MSAFAHGAPNRHSRAPVSAAPTCSLAAKVADLYIALLHHPVVDRNARIVTAAITSLDIHDLARSARTYEARGFFVVHPVAEQREFAARVIEHWFEEPGRAFDSRREEALRLARVVATLDEALTVVHHESG